MYLCESPTHRVEQAVTMLVIENNFEPNHHPNPTALTDSQQFTHSCRHTDISKNIQFTSHK